MFGTKAKDQRPSLYATREDFCQIFQKDMNRLYRLSFLLTADQTIAEQCFVGGLHIAQEGNPVFKEWAQAWARRAIILNAIRMIRPRLADGKMLVPDRSEVETMTEPSEMAAVVGLPAFERFAFVMSVLEGYSDHECSLHLGCTVGDVVAARNRALERLGHARERQKIQVISAVHSQRIAHGNELPLAVAQ
jgi:DNA-directed RNA polymerase specialized sigma24 family protein